jgi:hypothetical protein
MAKKAALKLGNSRQDMTMRNKWTLDRRITALDRRVQRLERVIGAFRRRPTAAQEPV